MQLKVDSRKIVSGDTFLALRGVESDGHNYIEKAIQNGATKIIAEEGNYSVATEIVKDTREYLANYLKEYYKDTMSHLKIIGITGTNGKTTTAFLLHKAFYLLGIKAAYIGTIGYYRNEKVRPLNNTTPDLYDLYEMFEESYQNGCKVVVLEVSSQGLSYGRVKGITFDECIFTNLTQDHLDYHKTMGNYAKAKQQLFYQLKENGTAIINVDDPYKDLYLLNQNNNVTYGFTGGDYQITTHKMSHTKTTFTFSYKEKSYLIETKLLGNYNIYNALSCIATLHEYGISILDIVKIFPKLETPNGRMDVISYGSNSIIVDYAHTPDAMEKILSTVTEIHPNHIYVVFGCTGDRDRTKRPIMTELVLKNSDYAIITSDDLHNEDPNQILDDMLKKNKRTNYKIILDRPKAIAHGISLLKENDILLILGKGHEEFMIIKEKKIPMNDKQIVCDTIKQYQN